VKFLDKSTMHIRVTVLFIAFFQCYLLCYILLLLCYLLLLLCCVLSLAYVFSLLCMFRSVFSISLFCPVYCLCVNGTVLLQPGVNPIAVKYVYDHHHHIAMILGCYESVNCAYMYI
jgi:hypothetical protein